MPATLAEDLDVAAPGHSPAAPSVAIRLGRVAWVVGVAVAVYCIARLFPTLDLISGSVLFGALLLSTQGFFSVHLMLYAWEHPERLARTRGPQHLLSPKLTFTVLLPARHEEAVIYETIQRVVTARYPQTLIEVVVICHADDPGTIAEVRRAIESLRLANVRLVTFEDGPINKPHGLNIGLHQTSNEIVTIFDAEDDIDPDIFNVINTAMQQEGVNVVQSGVQLMNFRDHWFAIYNVLEYFFWFKSRLHFHAQVGMIPLGGNTVFIRRALLEQVGGWDETCLTEDADIGIELSALGERIRVVYDPRHATREETPDSVGSFVRQRTRWNQGFLQVLRKRTWLELPTVGQRALALYTLSYPFFHALVSVTWPVAILAVFFLKLPVAVSIISFLPLLALVFQFTVSVVGAYAFAAEYGLKMPISAPLVMAVTFLPYQWLLGWSALRAVWREARRQNNWEKTEHQGAHRRPSVPEPVPFQPVYAAADQAYHVSGSRPS